MSELVDAWNKNTGKRHVHKVPKHFIGHKVLGPDLVAEPPRSVVVSEAASVAANKEEEKNA